jgi:hypothetical protein
VLTRTRLPMDGRKLLALRCPNPSVNRGLKPQKEAVVSSGLASKE